MSAAVLARPASPFDVVALQYSNRNRMVGVPLYILGAVIVIAALRRGRSPKDKDRGRGPGVEPLARGPEEFAAQIAADRAVWVPLIRELGITLDG